ncbi:MAG: hypothetical protein Kow0042_18600 [Calditrichia bacterium]
MFKVVGGWKICKFKKKESCSNDPLLANGFEEVTIRERDVAVDSSLNPTTNGIYNHRVCSEMLI